MIAASIANVSCDESGHEFVEYSLVIALLARVCIVALRVFSKITSSTDTVENAR